MRQRKLSLIALGLVVVAVCASNSFAQTEYVTIAHTDLNLSFAVPGKIVTKHVKPGSVVKEGQILIALDDRVGAALVERWKALAENDAQVLAATAQLEVDKVELDRVRVLNSKGVATEIELRRAEATVRLSELNIVNAQVQQAANKADHKQYVARYEQNILTAPSDGVIEKLEKAKGEEVAVGEMIDAGQPVLRLVCAKTLMVDASIMVSKTLSLKVGDAVWVSADVNGHRDRVEGEIVHISKVTEPASNTKLVRIDIPNEEHYLDPGWRVRVVFDDSGAMSPHADSSRRE